MPNKHPTRLRSYNDKSSFYPRELTELNGKLYITRENGKTEVLNDEDDTGVSAGNYGPSVASSISNGGTFLVPFININSKGKIVSAASRTMTLPKFPENPTIEDDTTSTQSASHSGTITVVDNVTRDDYGRVLKINKKTITLPAITHTSITKETDTTNTEYPSFGGTFTTVDSVTRDVNGHVTKINTKTITLPSITHISVTKDTDSTSNASPTSKGTFTTVDSITRDTYGHVTKVNTKTVTLPNPVTYYTTAIGTSWSGTAAPFTQTITINGMLATDEPEVNLVQNSSLDTALLEMVEYDKIYKITTAANKITVYATDKTNRSINLRFKCVR